MRWEGKKKKKKKSIKAKKNAQRSGAAAEASASRSENDSFVSNRGKVDNSEELGVGDTVKIKYPNSKWYDAIIKRKSDGSEPACDCKNCKRAWQDDGGVPSGYHLYYLKDKSHEVMTKDDMNERLEDGEVVIVARAPKKPAKRSRRVKSYVYDSDDVDDVEVPLPEPPRKRLRKGKHSTAAVADDCDDDDDFVLDEDAEDEDDDFESDDYDDDDEDFNDVSPPRKKNAKAAKESAKKVKSKKKPSKKAAPRKKGKYESWDRRNWERFDFKPKPMKTISSGSRSSIHAGARSLMRASPSFWRSRSRRLARRE